MEFQTKYPGPWVDIASDNLLDYDVGNWRHRNPEIDKSKCSLCGQCYLYCPTGCIEDKDTFFRVNLAFCKGCGICAKICPSEAISMKTGGRK